MIRMNLSERLISWAQNEEMIDQGYLAHGRDCLEAARMIRQMDALAAVLESVLHISGAWYTTDKTKPHIDKARAVLARLTEPAARVSAEAWERAYAETYPDDYLAEYVCQQITGRAVRGNPKQEVDNENQSI